MEDKLEPELRRDFATADLASFIQTLPPHNAEYIPHGIIRSLLLVASTESRFSWNWSVNVTEAEGGWVANGTLTLSWPTLENGVQATRIQTVEEVSSIERDPATASSRLFCRAVAFSCGLGLQAWSPRGHDMLSRRLTST